MSSKRFVPLTLAVLFALSALAPVASGQGPCACP